MQYVKNIKLDKEIINQNQQFRIGICEKLGIYLMAVNVPWIVWYDRYYLISEEDYVLYQENPDSFIKKYEKEISRDNKVCFTEHFIGSAALRDYDGREGFQKFFRLDDDNVFQGYLWHDNILFARICYQDYEGIQREFYVPPVQAVLKENGTYDFSLRKNCVMIKTDQNICYSYQFKNPKDYHIEKVELENVFVNQEYQF